MKDSIGGSALLYLVIIFVSIIMLLFSSILTYSKGYKIKNRIIEVIEKYEKYEEFDSSGKNKVTEELNEALSLAGYNAKDSTKCDSIHTDLTSGSEARYTDLSQNKNIYGYNYCVFESLDPGTNGNYYVIVSFVEFQIPIVSEFVSIPVYGETKILGKDYDY